MKERKKQLKGNKVNKKSNKKGSWSRIYEVTSYCCKSVVHWNSFYKSSLISFCCITIHLPNSYILKLFNITQERKKERKKKEKKKVKYWNQERKTEI